MQFSGDKSLRSGWTRTRLDQSRSVLARPAWDACGAHNMWRAGRSQIRNAQNLDTRARLKEMIKVAMAGPVAEVRQLVSEPRDLRSVASVSPVVGPFLLTLSLTLTGNDIRRGEQVIAAARSTRRKSPLCYDEGEESTIAYRAC
eukprot:scaffold1903_cov396-Prasinococcus_capsulatus_cf.AAC.29